MTATEVEPAKRVQFFLPLPARPSAAEQLRPFECMGCTSRVFELTHQGWYACANCRRPYRLGGEPRRVQRLRAVGRALKALASVMLESRTLQRAFMVDCELTGRDLFKAVRDELP